MYNENDKERQAIELATTLVKWGMKTILKIFVWITVIELVMACATVAVTKCTKIERRVEIQKQLK